MISGEVIDLLARHEIAGIKEDVRGLSRDVHHLRDNMATRVDMASLAAAIAKQEEGRRPQWQALGVMLAFAGAIGALAYWPILKGTDKLESALVETNKTVQALFIALPDKFPSIREHERLLRRVDRDLVPRSEIDKTNSDRDARIAGSVRRLERLETLILGRRPGIRIQGDEP